MKRPFHSAVVVWGIVSNEFRAYNLSGISLSRGVSPSLYGVDRAISTAARTLSQGQPRIIIKPQRTEQRKSMKLFQKLPWITKYIEVASDAH